MKITDLNPANGYLAFVLDDVSRTALLKLETPAFDRVIAHHVTIEFNPTAEKLKKLAELLGDDPVVVVNEIATGKDFKVQAAHVSINGSSERLDGNSYHVTISLDSATRKPVDSNKLWDSSVPGGVASRNPVKLKLTGQVKMVTR